MSDIGLILNGLLGVLLVGALALGWRLDGRLKALRASQGAFAKAVEDLDRAAARAEQGLADLRAATDEAAESLAGRIERAKSLSVRLEALTGQATNIEARLGRVQAERDRPVAPRADEASPRRAAAGREISASRPAAPRATGLVRADLILEDEAPARRETPAAAERLQRLRNLAALSGRLRGEEDIVAAAPPRRAAGGAR